MLYLKGQCCGVTSTSLVVIAFSKIQSCHYPLSEREGEKKKKKKERKKRDPQATTHTHLNLKFTLSSCFQRGKKCSHHKCKKGTMQARWNTVCIMYHRRYFMLYFHWFKKWHSLHLVFHPSSSHYLPCNLPAIFFFQMCFC